MDARTLQYKDNFISHLKNVLLTVFQVTFTEEELPKGSGDFILGYYSNNMSSIVGVTEPFQVIAGYLRLNQSNAFPLGVPFPSEHFYFKCLPLLYSFSSVVRSCFPPQARTAALQTALTSLQKMTVLLS